MLHGTHYQALSSDAFRVGKTWGPWLWYLNNGSKSDAQSRATHEYSSWPYEWFSSKQDGQGNYQSRGTVSGTLRLSDGRPAAGAAVFLGDNHPNETTLDMGRYNYYNGYADDDGYFEFQNVRNGTYGLQAWSNGGDIADVTSTYLQNDVKVSAKRMTDLGNVKWQLPTRGVNMFRVGDFDRKALGFKYGGAPYQHALVANCPANILYTVGQSNMSDWCFGQTYVGNWTVRFYVDSIPSTANNRSISDYIGPNNTENALLTVSLAGYSATASSSIFVNGQTKVGNLSGIASDPCLYRSGTTAGEWHYFEFGFDGRSLFSKGWNEVTFALERNTTWRGFMWDAVSLDWL
jgi:rhamnogalacturonan endolyase